MRNLLLVVCLLIAVAGVGYAVVVLTSPVVPLEPPASVGMGRQAFEAGDFAAALQTASEVLATESAGDPSAEKNSAALMLAGESATQLGKYDLAIDFYSQVSDSAAEAAVANWAMGEVHFHLGQTSPAFTAIEKSLALDPKLMVGHQRMIELCNVLGRRRESLPSLMYMFQARQLSPEYLFYVGNLAKETVVASRLLDYLAKSPGDLLPNLGLAQLAFLDGDLERADALLEPLLKQQADLVEAYVWAGMIWLQTQPDRLVDWNAALPEAAEKHPDIWFIRGQWLRADHGQEAVRCMAEAIRRDPNHVKAHQAMAQLLNAQGESERAKLFADKADRLQEVNTTLERLYGSRDSTALMHKAAQFTFDLGRLWECVGWSSLAKSVEPGIRWPQELVAKVEATAPDPEMPQTLASASLVAASDWVEEYPLPVFADRVIRRSDEEASRQDFVGSFGFRDIADEVGLDFEFDNHNSAVHQGHRMYQTSGGGIGVIDYDLDGRPDLFFSQGGDFPADPASSTHQDVLYRNRISVGGGLELANVTAAAGLMDYDFGQGVAVGDVNGDGFDDLYVGNIGANQLWLNRGDGTFEDASALIPADNSWTSSVMIADLNLDGRAEIYEANYLAGDDVYAKMCQIGGQPRSCSPLEFLPAADRLLSVGPQGELDVVDLNGAMVANSFGVVAMKLAGRRLPSLFVAADQQANLLAAVVPDPEVDSGFGLVDEAILLGLAYDGSGRAQACMGIAAGDVTGDGEIDLFVTNFYLEYNTLYLQNSGLFSDRTAVSGTVAASKPMLGFGTQFFDAQLDGNQDLFVLNGHIDDQTHVGVPEKMPPQFFAGLGGGKFQLVSPDDATSDPQNSCLAQLGLGRALAKVDIDDDGMVDLACGQLEDAGTSLIRNESMPEGRFVSVNLIGIKSDRNALFAKGTLRSDGFQQQLQLVAGSGYQASNQRVLHFSIPERALGGTEPGETELELEIEWPSGGVDFHRGVKPDKRYLAVESQGLREVIGTAQSSGDAP
ncbi:FG-GAP-like repeat-containing protein [Rosistilla oblonga]|uniref:FG-GAP-like repeat-containing protein n=1 Tax=Rosistilla oblonga TaxID=2527990 RepID=UPI003A96CA83